MHGFEQIGGGSRPSAFKKTAVSVEFSLRKFRAGINSGGNLCDNERRAERLAKP